MSAERTTDLASSRAVAVIDTDAIEHNVRTLRRLTNTPMMAVVKADGYGHGAVMAARAALAGGAAQLGVAFPTEALELRREGIDAPILAWLWPPEEDISAAAAAGVALGVSSLAQLDRVAATATGVVGVHLKVDTGLGRGGSAPHDWERLCLAALEAQRRGELRVLAVMSHLANAELVGDHSIDAQLAQFRQAVDTAHAVGLTPDLVHLANTAGAVGTPATRFDLVRCGIGIYGLDPLDAVGLRDAHGLRPAMTLKSVVALTKRVPAGHGVSYNLTYRTATETTLALVSIGYADGIPRAASSRATVGVVGRRYAIAGRVAMDQFVIDVGDDAVVAGDEVIVFGDGRGGEPTAADWAAACNTIDYEIVTRIGPRVPRVWRSGS